jgi:aminopeptidase YwaD
MRDSTSANVIGELPGSDPDAGILYLSGHHDTQAGSPGADDNGSGTVGVLELARVLAPLPRRHTIRLIAFGAEEQLSVGSAHYVRRHRDEIAARGRLVFNLDSYGSRMGWTKLSCNGPVALAAAAVAAFHARERYIRVTTEVCPYTDLFPFVVTGVPGFWLFRENCSGGRWFHHRPDDDLSRVDTTMMAGLLDVVAGFVHDAANRQPFPYARTIPAAQAGEASRYWDDLYGGWQG